MKKSIQLILLILMTNISSSVAYAQQVKNELPERKQTTLGLYVTAKEAYSMWQANPDKVQLLDIRTVVEYIWVGHPEMSLTIPAFNQTSRWDDQLKMFALEPDKNFVLQVEKRFAKDAILLLFCRSGDRSARAVDMLAKAGFTKAYTITDGFEGDMVTDPESVFVGKRMKNGWNNSGLPWTYKVDPKQVVVPETK
jgi:rhodanese-related sulfurtransferase